MRGRKRKRGREQLIRRFIRILKNSRGSVPIRETGRRASTTEIDAGNAISSGRGGAFILRCTFSVHDPRANSRICINTGSGGRIREGILRGRGSDAKLTKVCRQSYYLSGAESKPWIFDIDSAVIRKTFCTRRKTTGEGIRKEQHGSTELKRNVRR